MELDKTPDPLDIRLLRAYAVVLVPGDIAGTFKQAERLRWRSAVFSGIGGAVPGWTARLTSTLR